MWFVYTLLIVIPCLVVLSIENKMLVFRRICFVSSLLLFGCCVYDGYIAYHNNSITSGFDPSKPFKVVKEGKFDPDAYLARKKLSDEEFNAIMGLKRIEEKRAHIIADGYDEVFNLFLSASGVLILPFLLQLLLYGTLDTKPKIRTMIETLTQERSHFADQLSPRTTSGGLGDLVSAVDNVSGVGRSAKIREIVETHLEDGSSVANERRLRNAGVQIDNLITAASGGIDSLQEYQLELDLRIKELDPLIQNHNHRLPVSEEISDLHNLNIKTRNELERLFHWVDMIIEEQHFMESIKKMDETEYALFIDSLNGQINSPLGDKTKLCEKRNMAEYYRNKPTVNLWAIFWWSCFVTAAMCGFVLLAQNI